MMAIHTKPLGAHKPHSARIGITATRLIKQISVISFKILTESKTVYVMTQDRIAVCLTSWTSYLRTQPKTVSPDILHVLIQSCKPEDEATFLDTILSIPSEDRVEVCCFHGQS